MKKKHIDKSVNLVKTSSEAGPEEKKNMTFSTCDACDFTAGSKTILNEHIENVHNSDFWLVGSKRRKKNNENESSVKIETFKILRWRRKMIYHFQKEGINRS